jgi:hypothetical protein
MGENDLIKNDVLILSRRIDELGETLMFGEKKSRDGKKHIIIYYLDSLSYSFINLLYSFDRRTVHGSRTPTNLVALHFVLSL